MTQLLKIARVISEVFIALLQFFGAVALIILLVFSSALGQVVTETSMRVISDVQIYFSCDHPDAGIYITERRTEADERGIWFKTRDVYLATHKYYVTSTRMSASLVVCLVDEPYKVRIRDEYRYKRSFEKD